MVFLKNDKIWIKIFTTAERFYAATHFLREFRTKNGTSTNSDKDTVVQTYNSAK